MTEHHISSDAANGHVTEGILEIHETHEKIEHAHHQQNKRAAILIIGLAAALAISEMAGKEAQFSSIAHNIESSDLWAFYQAKTIRSTMVHTAIDAAGLLSTGDVPADQLAARQKQVETWKSAVDRFDSDPATHEGRKELAERAGKTAELRDEELHAYHHFEYGSAALQLAIVMASAAVITELTLLEIVSAALGVAGVAFGLLGWFAPGLIAL
ncbi:MAG: DUF4337 domain-containing protein [Alphaproteobacteria bacterium]|nr:DUF4337 domain-containing protein [Alphaproteobacteria bacterium]